MIDFVKSGVSNHSYASLLLSNKEIPFYTTVERHTGLLGSYYTAKINNLVLQIKGTYVELTGSFHRFWNIVNGRGDHNYNDFGPKDLAWTLGYLQNNYGIDPDIMRIQNLEYGYNLITSYNPNSFLDSLIIFKMARFRELSDTYGNERYKGAVFNQYILKFYNKGAQNKINQNILRCELKYKTMKAFNYPRPIFLSDLLTAGLLDHGHRNLKYIFKDLLVKEKVVLPMMTKTEITKFHECSQVETWTDWYSADSPTKITSNRLKEKKDYFNKLIKRYGQQNFKEVISNLMDDKFEELMSI